MMDYIKELDEWLADSESREKEIDFDNITIVFNKLSHPSRFNISVVDHEKEILNTSYYVNFDAPTAITIFNFIIRALLNNAEIFDGAANKISKGLND